MSSNTQRPAISRDHVAQKARVSAATVSRVYNNPELVRPETRDLVLQTAAEIGYAPNKAASALRRSGTGTVLFVDCDRHHPERWSEVNQLFYARALRSVRLELDATMFQLGLHSVHDTDDIHLISKRAHFDCVIMFDLELDSEAEAVAALGCPYVLCHHTAHFEDHSRCYTDNFTGGQNLGVHLRDCGYNKAKFVGNRLDTVVPHTDRLNGFLEGFGSGSCTIYNEAAGEVEMRRYAHGLVDEVRKGSVDCIVALNDFCAVNIALVLLADGLRIPDDVGLAGYDNSLLTYALPFRLTSVDLGLERVYKRATQHALSALRGAPAADEQVAPVVVPGTSTRGRD